MPPPHEAPIEFLVVGDDADLVRSVRDTLKAGKVGNRVDTVATVDAAMDHLAAVGDTLANVVVLALPDGVVRELVAVLGKEGGAYQEVPVIGIARDEAGVASDVAADGWLTQPFSVAQVFSVLRDLKGFGLTIVRGVAA